MSQLAQRLLMAAGGAKKETTYVEDVFSTYLYQGNDNYINVANGVKLSNANYGNSVNFVTNPSPNPNHYLITNHSNDFDFGSGDFTVEAWIYPNNATQTDPGMVTLWNFPDGRRSWGIFGNTGGSGATYNGAVRGTVSPDGQFATRTEITGTLTLNSWNHVAFVRNGNTLNFFINGVSQGTASYTGSVYNNTSDGVMIGAMGDSAGGNNYFNGNISNVRVVKGTCLYTGNFTPPTAALTSVTNTKLLCCQSSVSSTTTTVNSGGGMTAHKSSSVVALPSTQSFGPFTATDGKGGLVWIKNRDTAGYLHALFDTERGTTNAISTNLTNTTFTEVRGVTSFNNSGFTIGGVGGDLAFNKVDTDYASWTFAKQPGFFDIVKYTGNNVAGRQIPHNLGCTPGFYTVKCLEANNEGEAQEWTSYHTSYGAGQKFYLNKTEPASSTGYIGPATDTYFTVPATGATAGQINVMNRVGVEYVAYLWAGGQSPIDYSTYLDGGNDYLSIPAHNDLELDGDFTVECWVYNERAANNDRQTIIGNNISWTTNQSCIQINNPSQQSYENVVTVWDYNSDTGNPIAHSVGLSGNTGWVLKHSWHHIAVVRKSNNIRIYIDGALSNYQNQNNSATLHFGTGETWIGKVNISDECFNGKISNLRVVKGQALYETNFEVPKSPLTTTSQGATASNVKLLCCNTSTTTGSTVTPGTITANGDAAVNSNNPFMDANSKIFGKDGDQNIIACGKYTGKHEAADGPWVDLGWQPEYVLIKYANGSAAWQLFDTMRGITTGGVDMILYPDNNNAETTTQHRIRVMPLGFRLDTLDGDTTGDNREFIYMAIRKPDSYVGRPPEVGTDSFAMNTWLTGPQNQGPGLISNFPVDFELDRDPDIGSGWQSNWNARGRLLQGYYVMINAADAQQSGTWGYYDYNNGWLNRQTFTGYTNWHSWMWKRGAGFDIVNYYGNATAGRSVHHSLGVPPEMIWIKSRTNAYDWIVYNKFLNGGVTPEQWALKLSYTTEEQQKDWFNNQAPTATEFFVDGSATSNNNRDDFIAMLFATVDGISKCGVYDGQNSTKSIFTGFRPRFLFVKNITDASSWQVVDTLRGWGAGDDQRLWFDNGNAQELNANLGEPTATGFDLTGGDGRWNILNKKYIYYAHA